jgi:hypothetical protein
VVVVRSLSEWAGGYMWVDKLRANGFVAGIREKLVSNALQAAGLSTLPSSALLRAHGREVENQVTSSRKTARTYAAFSVPGIPGARGFTLSDGHSKGYNVAFSGRPFQYVVGAGFPLGAIKPTKAQVIAAAAALYRRVRGHPAP